MILKKPLITEKTNTLSEEDGRYSFVVDKRASKPEIKSAIEEMYGVKIESINTMIYAGKAKRNRKTGMKDGRTNSYKKAIVKLKEGEEIDLYNM